MAIKGNNNNKEEILLGVQVDIAEAEKKVQELEKKLDALQEVKLKVSGDALAQVNMEIDQTQKAIKDLNETIINPSSNVDEVKNVGKVVEDLNETIDDVNKNKVKPKSDNKEIKNTILSLDEMDDLLKKIRDEQRVTKDPLKLQQLSKEAGELELKIRDINEPFRDVNREIGELEDRLYAMATAGEQGSQEFNEILSKVAQLKEHVKNVDLAVDSLSVDRFGQFVQAGENLTGVLGGVTASMQLMGIESKTAEENIAKLMQLQSIMQGLQSLNQFRKQWTALMSSFKAGKVATETINTISTATGEASTATEGLATATKGATGATNGFGMAFKAIGIGLLVTALAYLITNFDKLKEVVFNLVPGLRDVAQFVGNIIQKISDFIGITSEAQRSLEKLKKLNEGIVTGIDSQIEMLSAMGDKEKEVYELSLKRNSLKRQSLIETAKVNKKLNEEEQKQLIELNTERNVLILSERKRINDLAKERADKAKQEYDTLLNQLKGYLKEAEKVTYSANHNSRQTELKNLSDKYKEQIAVARKLNQDISKLEQAERIERNIINKKYDDEYFNYIKGNSRQFLDDFSKEYLETIESYTKQKENATAEQKADLDTRLQNQLLYLSQLKQLSIAQKVGEKDLANSLDKNEIDDEADKWKFKQQREKLDAQLQATKDYEDTLLLITTESKNLENSEIQRLYEEGQARLKELMSDPSVNANEITNVQAELNAKLSAIEANNKEIEDATIKHQQTIQKAEKANTKAKKKILDEETKARLDNMSIVANATDQAVELLGESTVAGKVAGIATATIDTYVAGTKAMKETPYPFNFVALATTIASGLATVKKIMSVKVDGDTSGGAGADAPTFSAPVINSTVLKTAENGTDKLSDVITQSNENQVVKAYITNSDIETNEQKNQFIKRTSTY
ncbi:hypothetical protein [Sphingobacterium multivorum]|uniref:hypothetical protein n=1 Tax=Sphingobacterium multivorum TaxID=28454 RepID=UPI0028AE196A|nr:hypothetical protein [Sphingobacterium multivorum]